MDPNPWVRRQGRILLLLTIAVVAVLVSFIYVNPDGEHRAVAEDGSKTITLAYAGDSTTAQPNSWLTRLTDTHIKVIGGYAHDGYTSGQILNRISPVHADVLVIMVGINDIRFASTDSVDGVVDNVNLIAAKVGARHVLVSAVAPSDVTSAIPDGANTRREQRQLDRALSIDAAVRGWSYVDPYAALRNPSNGYASPFDTVDGVHPTDDGYAAVGAALTPAIERADSN